MREQEQKKTIYAKDSWYSRASKEKKMNVSYFGKIFCRE